MMKIIVTGGAGYIGSHTVGALFEAGFEPIIIDNFSNSSPEVISQINTLSGKNVKVYQVDCTEQKSLENVFKTEGNIKGIIHFAAYKAVGESVVNPLKYYNNNIISLIHILSCVKQFTIPYFVFSSSCTVYGEPEKIPVDENTPTQSAASPYGNTKQIGEEIIQDFFHSASIFKGISLRYFNPIGAHPSGKIGELPMGVPNNLVPYITQTAAGERDVLTIFGNDYPTTDQTCIRDYIHVMDLAEAHVCALQYLIDQVLDNFYDVFNIGTGKGNSVLNVIKTFERVNRIQLNYQFGPRRTGDIAAIFANPEKANKILGWQSKRSIDEALKDAWNWQKNRSNA